MTTNQQVWDQITWNRLEREAIAALSVGSKLYCISGRHWGRATIVEVTKMTATQLILEDGSRLKRDTLNKIGAPKYGQTHYHPVCPMLTQEVAKYGARR